jgi:acetamidase/formamidase
MTAHRVGPSQTHLSWDPAILPVLEVQDGAVVEFEMGDASGNQITAGSATGDLAGLDFSLVDPVHGPVFVAGAGQGDALRVDLLEFHPADWGWTAILPDFGLLADQFPEPALRISKVHQDHAELLPGLAVPVVPFCGELGLAPLKGPLSTIPPGLHGGNMDTRHLTAGASVLLPVQHPGALLSMGDGHAAQGDGEVCGTAIETPMRALVRVSVVKGLAIEAPEFMLPARVAPVGPAYCTNGIGPDLLMASREAVIRMIDWMGRAAGLAPADAYMLCSVAVDLRISEIVDLPNVIVTAHCPLSVVGL